MLDIISKRGEILPEKTLADRILKDFSIAKIKKAIVKVPNIKIRKSPNQRKKNLSILKPEKDNVTTASIVNILIKTALEKAKTEKKQKAPSEEKKSYNVIKEGFESNVNGGYGTISREYGITPKASYIDYGKLFSYLGKFRATQPYENMAEHLGALNKAAESESFTLADKQTIEKGAGYIKYFLGGLDLNPLSGVNPLSLVPAAGMTSSEWGQFKMWMQLDSVMYLLKSKIS